MGLFVVSLRQAMERGSTPYRKWSNTFFVETETAEAAASLVNDGWVNILRNHVREHVYAYQVYATDMLVATSEYIVEAIDPAFQRGVVSRPDEIYTPENCVAVSITVPASRPSRKFWRPGLTEADFGNGVFDNTTLLGQIISDFNDLIASGPFRDVDGQNWISVLGVKQSIRRLGRTAPFDVPAGPALG